MYTYNVYIVQVFIFLYNKIFHLENMENYLEKFTFSKKMMTK